MSPRAPRGLQLLYLQKCESPICCLEKTNVLVFISISLRSGFPPHLGPGFSGGRDLPTFREHHAWALPPGPGFGSAISTFVCQVRGSSRCVTATESPCVLMSFYSFKNTFLVQIPGHVYVQKPECPKLGNPETIGDRLIPVQ